MTRFPFRILPLFALITLVGLTGCRSVEQAWDDAHNAPPLRLDTGAITGRLTDAETSRPLATAHVELLTEDGVLVENQSARTWVSEGDFEFPNVKPGRYLVRVEAEGYEPYFSAPLIIRAGTIVRVQGRVTPLG